MVSFLGMRKAVLVGLFGIVLAQICPASTIVDVSGASNEAYTIVQYQWLATSWTQSGSFTDVSISAPVSIYDRTTDPPLSIEAYLVQDLGSSAISDTLVASQSIALGTTVEDVTLFSGLDLGAGTYYLVLAQPTLTIPAKDGLWYFSTSPVITTGAGVTLGAEYSTTGDQEADFNRVYPPGSPFPVDTVDSQLLFSVTGSPVSAVPEPSLSLEVGLAIGALVLVARNRVRPPRHQQ
jgi:hypothetical protein